ncbi:reverse transcriptase family protein, partial [Trichinella spiralis]
MYRNWKCLLPLK